MTDELAETEDGFDWENDISVGESEKKIRQAIGFLNIVDTTHTYQTPAADFSIMLGHKTDVSRFRVFYLKNLRFKYEWVDSFEGDQQNTSHVLLKRR